MRDWMPTQLFIHKHIESSVNGLNYEIEVEKLHVGCWRTVNGINSLCQWHGEAIFFQKYWWAIIVRKLIIIGKHIFCFTSNCEHLLDGISIFLRIFSTCRCEPCCFIILMDLCGSAIDILRFSIAFIVDSSHLFILVCEDDEELRLRYRLIPHELNIIRDWFSFREFFIIHRIYCVAMYVNV